MAEYKIATWNVNSLNVRLPHVLQWLASEKPDVLALQETKCIDEKFPIADINAAGYQVIFQGQKTYNGVAILSKSTANDVITDIPDLDDPQRRILAATVDNIRVIDLYVPNGSEVGSEKYQYKLDWLAKVTAFVKAEMQKYERVVVLGDYNIAPADADIHDPKAWEGKILCSAGEREALDKLLSLGLYDSFRLFDQDEKSYSWWDYRMMGFRRNHGLRIDHLLISEPLKQICQSCAIDKEPRKLERPSDHAPVYVTLKI